MDKRLGIIPFAMAAVVAVSMLSGGGSDPVPASYRGGYYAASSSYRGGSVEAGAIAPSINRADYYTTTQIQEYPELEFYDGHYDSIATMDVIKHHMMLFDEDETPAFVGYVDSVRLRNPDAVILDYLYVWGAEDIWVGADSAWTAGNIRHDYWTFVNDHNYWIHDTSGNRVQASPASSEAYLVNIGFNQTRVDSFAQFFGDYINKSGNSQEYTGVFLDYYNYPDYPDWPCYTGDCRDIIDMNENGLLYNFDATEIERERTVYKRAQDNFAVALRAAINHDKFIIISNGTAFNKSESYAAVCDGGYHEKVDLYFPASAADWEESINETYFPFSNAVLSHPLTVYDRPDAENEEHLVAISLITNGTASISHMPIATRRFWTLEESAIGRINLGFAVSGSGVFNSAVSDTAYRQFELGYIRFEPDVTGLTYWEHEYVVVDTVTNPAVPDTLLISSGWPAYYDPPAAPEELEAFAYDGQVNLHWGADPDPDIYVYRIYRGPDKDNLTWYHSPAPGVPPEFVDEGVVNGTTYFYGVTALNESSHESDMSNIVNATPLAEDLVFNSFSITGASE